MQSKPSLRLRLMSKPHLTGMKARNHGLGLNFLQNFARLMSESLITLSDIRIFVQEFAAR